MTAPDPRLTRQHYEDLARKAANDSCSWQLAAETIALLVVGSLIVALVLFAVMA